MNALPETIASGLIEKLNALRNTGDYQQKDSFVWAQIKRECDKLVQADATAGWAVMGMLYTTTGDVDEVDACFQRAYRLNPLIDIQVNWFASLSTLGFYSRALGMYAEIGRPELGVFSRTVDTAIYIGAFQMVHENFQAARRLGFDLSAYPVSLVEEATAIMAEAGLTDQDIARHLDAAGDVLRACGLFETSVPEILTSHDEGGFTGITMVLHVNRDASEVFRFNKALARRERELEIRKSPVFDVLIASA